MSYTHTFAQRFLPSFEVHCQSANEVVATKAKPKKVRRRRQVGEGPLMKV